MVSSLPSCLAVRVTSADIKQRKRVRHLPVQEAIDNVSLVGFDIAARVGCNFALISVQSVRPCVPKIVGLTRKICVHVRTRVEKPCPRTRIADPVSHIVVVGLGLFHERISLSSLSTHRVTCHNDLIEIGIGLLVEELFNDLINSGVTCDGVLHGRVPGWRTTLPARTVEDNLVGVSCTCSQVHLIEHGRCDNDERVVSNAIWLKFSTATLLAFIIRSHTSRHRAAYPARR